MHQESSKLRRIDATSYGRDLLTSLGTTPDGSIVHVTSDRVYGLRLAWTHRHVPGVTLRTADGTHPQVRAALSAALQSFGIESGTLTASSGLSLLHQGGFDPVAARAAAAITGAANLAGAVMSSDKIGHLLRDHLRRPSGAHLPGVNIIRDDGTCEEALHGVPAFVAVQVHTSTAAQDMPNLTKQQVELLRQAHTLEELTAAMSTTVEDITPERPLLDDVFELGLDKNTPYGVLPGPGDGFTAPFPRTPDGFQAATKYRVSMQSALPGVTALVTNTWRAEP